MRMRLDAITRSPPSSSILVIAPVMLRRVASGLMIEKVRSVVMAERSPKIEASGIAAAPSRANRRRQGSGFFDPAAALVVRPEAAVDPVPSGQQFPRQPGAFERVIVEQIESAVVAQSRLAPLAVGDQHVAGEVGRV